MTLFWIIFGNLSALAAGIFGTTLYQRRQFARFLKDGETPIERMDREHADNGALLIQLADERAKCERLKASYAIRQRADARAIERWTAEDPKGRALILPDHADLCVWLLERQAELEAWKREAVKTLEECGVSISHLSASNAALKADLANADADNEELRKALRPFARLGDQLESPGHARLTYTSFAPARGPSVMAEDFYRARKLIPKETP